MRYVIKNNRLTEENPGVTNLSELSEEKLSSIAKRYQVGTMIRSFQDEKVVRKGRETTRKVEAKRPKSRRMIEDEIRRRLSIIVEIPADLWTQEQRDFVMMNNLPEIKDGDEEKRLKEEVGIRFVMPPHEKTNDERKELKMLFEVSRGVWQYLQETHNFKITTELDQTGKRIANQRRVKRNMLVLVEEVNDDGTKKEDAPKGKG